MIVEPTEPIEIFICYAREDEEYRQGLEKQLRILKRQGLITVWHDREIVPGTEWQSEIDMHLKSAQIILLLVSPDFMDSDYCYSIEMQKAMERHQRGEAHVIPIIVHHVIWQEAPFGKLQVLPTDAKPITDRSWHSLNEAYFSVAVGIREVIEKVKEERQRKLKEEQQRQVEAERQRKLREEQLRQAEAKESIRRPSNQAKEIGLIQQRLQAEEERQLKLREEQLHRAGEEQLRLSPNYYSPAPIKNDDLLLTNTTSDIGVITTEKKRAVNQTVRSFFLLFVEIIIAIILWITHLVWIFLIFCAILIITTIVYFYYMKKLYRKLDKESVEIEQPTKSIRNP